jgi:competence protein ComEA
MERTPTVECVGEISKQQLAVWAAAAIALALIGARYLKESDRAGPPPRSAPRVAVRHSQQGAIVQVTGAVRRPGVYRVPGWARLNAAVRRAGGPTASADLAGVNLAAKVADGQQIIVPERGAGGATAAASASGLGGETGMGPPVSLNTATVEQLDELEGVGPVTAQKILDWRKQHGGFRSVDDLKQISGIGPKRFETLKDKVRM